MKRYLLSVILIVLFIAGCKLDVADDIDSFPKADYSFMVKESQYEIPVNTTALQIFNCFYSEYGYGEYDVQGQYSHTESAVLNGNSYTDTITKTITKMKIWHVRDENTKGSTISSFYVTFYTDNNESLEYRYQWQYQNTNAWKNNKTDGTIIIFK